MLIRCHARYADVTWRFAAYCADDALRSPVSRLRHACATMLYYSFLPALMPTTIDTRRFAG